MRRPAVGLTALALAGAAAAQTWDFEVRLDEKPIGTHRFVVGGTAAAREVDSRASFDVRLLGIPVYRYRHQAQERWQDDCLRELHARTDDDGRPLRVDLQRDEAAPDSPGCVMGFAYWHPRLPTQRRLLNPQTGEIEDVRFERLPDATVTAQGRELVAARWRLSTTPPGSPGAPGTPQELVLWLDRADGRWIGLDARVRGGRLLSYRLR